MRTKYIVILVIALIVGGIWWGWKSNASLHNASSTGAIIETPEQVIRSYITHQTQMEFDKAMMYLTGDAWIKMRSLNGNVKGADNLKELKIIKVAEQPPLAKYSTYAETGKGRFELDFYLYQAEKGWRIFSIQPVHKDWDTLTSASLTKEQEKVIQRYTQAISNGNVVKASEDLSNETRNKLGMLPKSMPKQKVLIEKIGILAKTTKESLIKVDETITDQTGKTFKQQLLYEMTMENKAWKIHKVSILTIEKAG